MSSGNYGTESEEDEEPEVSDEWALEDEGSAQSENSSNESHGKQRIVITKEIPRVDC